MLLAFFLFVVASIPLPSTETCKFFQGIVENKIIGHVSICYIRNTFILGFFVLPILSMVAARYFMLRCMLATLLSDNKKMNSKLLLLEAGFIGLVFFTGMVTQSEIGHMIRKC